MRSKIMQDLIRDWREKERSLAYKKFLMNCSVLNIIGVGQAEVYEGDKKLNKGACQYMSMNYFAIS